MPSSINGYAYTRIENTPRPSRPCLRSCAKLIWPTAYKLKNGRSITMPAPLLADTTTASEGPSKPLLVNLLSNMRPTAGRSICP